MIIRHFFRIIPNLKILYYKEYNKLFFKLHGMRYGTGLKLLGKMYVLGPGHIEIGDNFLFTSGDAINPISRNIRGVLCTMQESSIIKIGNNVGISSSCIWAKESISIGNNVIIGGDCIIMDNDVHPLDYNERRERNVDLSKCKSAPVYIEDDVWIGARCIILKGVHIGARSVIAAGSIVTRDIPPDCVAGGNPCKVIRNILNEDICSNSLL